VFGKAVAIGAALLLGAACGAPGAGSPTAATPTPAAVVTPIQYDLDLKAQLDNVSFKLYATPLQFDGYVFSGSGLDYYKTDFGLQYGGLSIDEWRVTTFNPSSGFCKPEVDAPAAGYCALIGASPAGRQVYGLGNGGLKGPPTFEALFLVLNATGVNFRFSISRRVTLKDVYAVADALAPATPAGIITLNQKARALAESLHDTAPSRLDFKTYLPERTVGTFAIDRMVIGNPTDPLHPYLDLHYRRTAIGNQAFEFWVSEFRDDTRLSPGHCGVVNPEITLEGRCASLFTTPAGTPVYGTYGSTRFDRGSTRISIHLDLKIDQLTQDEMAAYVDSFHEVDATTIPAICRQVTNSQFC